MNRYFLKPTFGSITTAARGRATNITKRATTVEYIRIFNERLEILREAPKSTNIIIIEKVDSESVNFTLESIAPSMESDFFLKSAE